VPKATSARGPFTLGVIRAEVNPTACLCSWADYLCVPAVGILTLHPAKPFGLTGVCPGCVISEQVERLEKGGKADPFRYCVKDSCFVVPYI
jgi:hypothetical protein